MLALSTDNHNKDHEKHSPAIAICRKLKYAMLCLCLLYDLAKIVAYLSPFSQKFFVNNFLWQLAILRNNIRIEVKRMGLKDFLCRYVVPDEINLKFAIYRNVRERCGCEPLLHDDELSRNTVYLATIRNQRECNEVGGQWKDDACHILR